MKAKSLQLTEQRSTIVAAMEAIYNVAATEDRNLSTEELTSWEARNTEVEDLDQQIKVAKTMEREAALLAGGGTRSGISKEEERNLEDFSFLKLIRNKANGNSNDGLEAEMIQEGEREARGMGKNITGFAIPNLILNHRTYLNHSTRTTLTAGTAATAGNLIQDGKLSFVEALRAQLQVVNMGATLMTDLQGEMPFVIQDGVTIANWAAENGTSQESNPTTTIKNLTPKRLTANVPYSKRLLYQSSVDVEAMVRRELIFAEAQALDLSAINGTGSSNQPTGILNTSNIGSVSAGTNGGVPSKALIDELETIVSVANANVGTLGYLTNPLVRGKLKNTVVDAGSGRFVWDSTSPMELNGYNAQVTTNMPSNLTKGTGTNLSSIIYGNFSDLVIGQFGSGLDLVIDPYTSAKDNIVNVVMNSEYDVLVKRPESFAAMVDVITA